MRSLEIGKREELSRQRLQDVRLWRQLQRDLHLSNREIQVAILILLGRSVRQCGVQLGVRPGTVLCYLARLRRKTATRCRAELILKLILASGLILGEQTENHQS